MIGKDSDEKKRCLEEKSYEKRIVKGRERERLKRRKIIGKENRS